ncbi:hypothetical protein LXA47_31450 [Massilia sp. P8910]|uniref:hypothetical protein n=1 Tax=Massilia antarctica TaxID=2765360 RepID=UPI001E4CA8DB|nr:hypothetical protein [Massilia antarctica]MCE3608088.1 hypothetical protein [Massilia antarctica]
MKMPSFSLIPIQVKIWLLVGLVVAAIGAVTWFGYRQYEKGYARAELEYKAAVSDALAARDAAQAKATAFENDKNLALAALASGYIAKQRAPQARLAASVAAQPARPDCAGPAQDKVELNTIIREANKVKK